MLKLPKHVGFRWVGISFAPLLLGFLLAGCGAIPISGALESPLYGKRVDEQEVASVAAVGKSREEVISDLGKPTIELKELRILVYSWIEHKGDWLIFGVGYVTGVAGSFPRHEDWSLLVAFDDQDRVTHAGLVKKKSSESINTTARNWAEAQGINIPPLQTTFALSSVPVGKSLLYVFWTTPPTSWKTILGAAISWPFPLAIAVDGQYLSEMRNKTYIALTVEPGTHELLADALPPYRYVERGTLVIRADRRRPASVTLNTLPNQVYFIELLCTTGTGDIETSLVPKTEADALPVIRDFRPVW